MDPAEVVLREPRAGAVRAAPQNQPAAVWRDLRLTVDEILLCHAEERGDARDLGVRHAHNAILDPAARPALTADEPRLRGWR